MLAPVRPSRSQWGDIPLVYGKHLIAVSTVLPSLFLANAVSALPKALGHSGGIHSVDREQSTNTNNKKINLRLFIVGHTFNPSIRESEAGGSL